MKILIKRISSLLLATVFLSNQLAFQKSQICTRTNSDSSALRPISFIKDSITYDMLKKKYDDMRQEAPDQQKAENIALAQELIVALSKLPRKKGEPLKQEISLKNSNVSKFFKSRAIKEKEKQQDILQYAQCIKDIFPNGILKKRDLEKSARKFFDEAYLPLYNKGIEHGIVQFRLMSAIGEFEGSKQEYEKYLATLSEEEKEMLLQRKRFGANWGETWRESRLYEEQPMFTCDKELAQATAKKYAEIGKEILKIVTDETLSKKVLAYSKLVSEYYLKRKYEDLFDSLLLSQVEESPPVSTFKNTMDADYMSFPMIYGGPLIYDDNDVKKLLTAETSEIKKWEMYKIISWLTGTKRINSPVAANQAMEELQKEGRRKELGKIYDFLYKLYGKAIYKKDTLSLLSDDPDKVKKCKAYMYISTFFRGKYIKNNSMAFNVLDKAKDKIKKREAYLLLSRASGTVVDNDEASETLASNNDAKKKQKLYTSISNIYKGKKEIADDKKVLSILNEEKDWKKKDAIYNVISTAFKARPVGDNNILEIFETEPKEELREWAYMLWMWRAEAFEPRKEQVKDLQNEATKLVAEKYNIPSLTNYHQLQARVQRADFDEYKRFMKQMKVDLKDDIKRADQEIADLLKKESAELEPAPWNTSWALRDVYKEVDEYLPANKLMGMFLETLKDLGLDAEMIYFDTNPSDSRKTETGRFKHPGVCCALGEKDTRIIITLASGGRLTAWVMFHESGHAIDHLYSDYREGPTFASCDTRMKEGMARFIENMLYTPEWLAKYPRNSKGEQMPLELIKKFLIAHRLEDLVGYRSKADYFADMNIDELLYMISDVKKYEPEKYKEMFGSLDVPELEALKKLQWDNLDEVKKFPAPAELRKYPRYCALIHYIWFTVYLPIRYMYADWYYHMVVHFVMKKHGSIINSEMGKIIKFIAANGDKIPNPQFIEQLINDILEPAEPVKFGPEYYTKYLKDPLIYYNQTEKLNKNSRNENVIAQAA
ncbi:MAG: hypothetical protein V2A72_00870 [Candidatus Omnitrophota bacterium]